jgi:hypothetical protein
LIDLNDWRPEYDEAIEAADEFARRKSKSIPPDRWADGTIGLRKVALGIECYKKLLDAQTEHNRVMLNAVRELLAAQAETSAASMGVYNRHGKETS